MSDQTKQETGFQDICFGLDRDTDERSLALFLRLFNQEQLLEALIPRMKDDEIMQVVDQLTALLGKHFQEAEYHELFLGDFDHHH